MFNVVGLGGSLIAFWLLMSGHYGLLLLTLGGASILLVLYITHRMDQIDNDTFPFNFKPGIFKYWAWLGKEIFKANLDVAKVVLSPKMALSPSLIRIKASQKTDLGVVIFANSITLTPGTVSIDLEGNEIIVHALTRNLAEDLQKGIMDKRVTALEEV